jgi:hypothetical protein
LPERREAVKWNETEADPISLSVEQKNWLPGVTTGYYRLPRVTEHGGVSGDVPTVVEIEVVLKFI